MIEASLDAISQSMRDAVDLDWYFAIGFAGYDWRSSPFNDRVANVIAVIASISQKTFAFGNSLSTNASNPLKSETSPPVISALTGNP